MIRTYEQTPRAYSNESRDYQLFGHLFDLVFNNSKMNLDSIENNRFNRFIDRRLLEVVAKSLGFNKKHNYDDNNLYFLCKSFKDIIKHKGSKQALEDSLNLLIRAQGLNAEDLSITVDNNTYEIKLIVPENLKDFVLFKDLLDYILPAGYVMSVIYGQISKTAGQYTSSCEDSITVTPINASKIGDNYGTVTGTTTKIKIIPNHKAVVIGRDEQTASSKDTGGTTDEE